MVQQYLCNRNLKSVLRDRVGRFVREFGKNVDNGFVCFASRDVEDNAYVLFRDYESSRGWQTIFR